MQVSAHKWALIQGLNVFSKVPLGVQLSVPVTVTCMVVLKEQRQSPSAFGAA